MAELKDLAVPPSDTSKNEALDSPSRGESVQFGHKMRKFFLFDRQYNNLNHGSFGTYPSQVRSRMRHYQDLCEARPDRFIRYDYPKMLDCSRKLLADYFNAALDDIVLVPNATVGINTVLRNLRYNPGDKILYCSTLYGACEKTVEYVCETTPATSIRVELQYPLDDDDLLEAFRDGLKRGQDGGRVKIALFDAVSSLPGVRMPFAELTDICKQNGVLSLIDGAHAPGQVPIDLAKLQPDFFIGNCHKWLFAPRGCALLYVPRKSQPLMRSSLPTSHGFVPLPCEGKIIHNPLPPSAKSEFVNQFEYTGALDNSPFLCVPDCFQFIEEECGGQREYMEYCQTLARQGGAIVAKLLGTEVMDNKEGTLSKCFFSNVRLPLHAEIFTSAERSQVSQWITNKLVFDHHTFLAVFFHADSWWVRLSAQVYLESDDFRWVGQILDQLCRKINDGGFRDALKISDVEE
ncbi:PLP-dependent transferase [Cadophora sp. DSE1049]|nr:PLP-dependent transferase [Cadophora sp. DSE1049]